MKRLLFVDDEQRVLSGLRRQLHPHRAEWDMSFVDGGEAALALLAQGAQGGAAFDVIVSDMRMPGMDGAQLLSRVAREHPRLGRLVLSGHADPDRVQLARSCAHRYLNKPCAPETLETEIRRALAVRATLDQLAWATADELWRAPPSLFGVCADVFAALAGERTADVLAADLSRLFAQDAALWAELAPLLGAAFPAHAVAGSAPPVLTPEMALTVLGARPLMTLAMGRRFFESFVARPPEGEARWAACRQLAAQLASVAVDENIGAEVVAHALTAALLELPDQPCRHDESCCDDGCRQVLDYLLPTWGFPDPVVAAAAWRKSPARCPPLVGNPLAALLAAELLVGWSDPAGPSSPAREQELVAFLQQRGWTASRERRAAPAAGENAQFGTRPGR